MIRSGARTYNAVEDDFMEQALLKQLNDMTYSELRAYQYKLYLDAVKVYGSEAKLKEAYKKNSYTLCTSRDDKGDFAGRLTGYLKKAEFGTKTCFYICGSNEMIYDAKEIIENKGFDRTNIYSEVYF